MKCGMWISTLAPAAFSDAIGVLHTVEFVCRHVLAVLNPDPDSNSSSATDHGSRITVANSEPADATVIAPWVAIAARTAFAIAELLQQALPRLQQPAAAGDLFKPMLLCTNLLDLLREHSPATGLPEEVLQNLLLQEQQHVALNVELARFMRSGIDGTALQELHNLRQQHMPKLASLAGQVVAQLPLRWACNHPGCVNLGQASELVLVGGKGCVCSGCRSAR
jgi:hypothetical protein